MLTFFGYTPDTSRVKAPPPPITQLDTSMSYHEGVVADTCGACGHAVSVVLLYENGQLIKESYECNCGDKSVINH